MTAPKTPNVGGGGGDSIAPMNFMFRHLICFVLLGWLLGSAALYAEPQITELMAAGQSLLKDEDNAHPDWVEIYNPAPTSVNLGGWHLVDKLRRWTFPALVVPPGGFVVVFASGKDRKAVGGNLHTDFRIDGAGGVLLLTRVDGSLAQSFSFPAQLPDLSWDGANFLSSPTPGAVNSTAVEPITQAPEFSHDRGFYSSPFSLTMTSGTPSAAIYYTLDGREPGPSSALYSVPLRVTKTTVVRAVAISPGNDASPLTARTFLFAADIVNQSPNGAAPKGWPAAWGGNAVDYGMDPDITKKTPYSTTIKNDLRAVPSFSVVMELDDLFDESSGIYANSYSKGREWERPMSLEYIEPTGGGGFQIQGGIRIRGGASRDSSNPKHSLQFRFRKEYGAAHLDFPLFGPDSPSRTDGFDLRWDHLVSWHYSDTQDANQLQDIFGRDAQLAASGFAKEGNLCSLYLNGQYWGLYFIDERVNGDFGANHFGGSPSDYDVVRYDAESGATGLSDGTRRAWREAFDLGYAGFGDNARYFKALGCNPDGSKNRDFERLIDEENLIDYMLVGIWCGATDNPVVGGTDNNWTSIRSRKGDFGFRFFVHDFELSMFDVGGDFIGPSPSENVLLEHDAENINPWHFWMALRMNAEFRMKVADRVQKHFFNAGALTAEACVARWNARMEEMDRAIVAESARWGDGVSGGLGGPILFKRDVIIDPGPKPRPGNGGHRAYTRSDWLAGATEKRDGYIALRSAQMLEHLKNGGLFPTIPAPAYSTTAEAVTLTNPSGTGVVYFTLNGPDPRLVGGAVASAAQAISGSVELVRKATVRARVLDGENWSALVEFEFVPGVDFGALRVTEIHYNPAVVGTETSDDSEFLELKNTGTAALDLSNCRFSEGIDFTFPAGTTLPAGGFFVLARNAGVSPDGVFTGKLGDDGESLVLLSPSGARIFALNYDDEAPWPLAPDGFGASLVYDGKGNPDDGKNWRSSSAVGGSPGADDPAPGYFPRVVVNEIFGGASPFVELYNSGPTNADISGWLLGSDRALPPSKVFAAGTVIGPGEFIYIVPADGMPTLNAGGGSVFLAASPTGYAHQCRYGPLESDIAFGRHLNADGDEKFTAMAPTPGNANGAPLARGPLRISEVYYAQSTATHLDFVEIENTSASSVSLDGMRLVGMSYIFPAGTTLGSGERLVVTSAAEVVFRAEFPDAGVVLGPTTGDLQDDGERVALEQPVAGTTPTAWLVLDEVRYNDRYPWPFGAAGAGNSLHRLPLDYADESTAWAVGAPTPGGKGVDGRPRVSITSPQDRLNTVAGSQVVVGISAFDPDGRVAGVELFIDGRAVGEAHAAPYDITWSAEPGTHDIGARATDDAGNFADAKPVTIFVGGNEAMDGGEGLKAEYFPNKTLEGSPVETTVAQLAFDWAELSPAPGIPHAGFSARFSGKLLARSSGNHTLIFHHAGGIRVSIRGVLRIDQWMEPDLSGGGGFAISTTDEELTAGEPVDMVVEYFDADAFGHLSLAWYEPSDFNEKLVAQSQLYLPDQDVAAFGISTPALIPQRRLGQRVRVSLQTSRGVAPVVWRKVSGTLPAGVQLNAAGSLAGAAIEGGDFSFRLEAQDGAGEVASREFSLRIASTALGGAGPVVRITKPSPGATATAAPITLAGIVRGGSRLVSLSYSLNKSARHPMAPMVNWSVALNKPRGLIPGENEVQVFATDEDGREATGKVMFNYRFRSALSVSVNGAGTVSPGFLGVSKRVVGEPFSIQAKPAPGWVFSNWEPNFDPNPATTFEMVEDMSVTAVFVRNPFGPFVGRFVGLVGEDDKAAHYQLTLGKTGAFSFVLHSGKARLALSGVMPASGVFGYSPDEAAGLPSYLEIVLHSDNGTISVNTQFYGGDFFLFFESVASRADWATGCPAAGSWALALPSTGPDLIGTGFAAMKINRRGQVALLGKAADGSAISRGLLMADDASLPWMSPLVDTGRIFGKLVYTPQNGGRIDGTLSWVAPTLVTSLSANASPYTAPRLGVAAIHLPDGEAVFTDPDAAHSFTTSARLNSLNGFVFGETGSRRLSMRVDPLTGIVRGSYIHTATGQRIQVRGIVDPLTNSAAGVILSEPCGGFTILPTR